MCVYSNSRNDVPRVVGWLVGCFGFNGPLRQYFSLYQAASQREGEIGEKIGESKTVQTAPTRTYCKRNRPLPYYHPNGRTPRHWKFTQNLRTTRPPPSPSGSAVRNHCRTHPAPCVRPRCVCSVAFCVQMHSFAGLIRRTFSDTAITDPHSDTTIFSAQSSLGADILVYWIGKIVRTCAPVGVEPSTSCVQGEHPIH